jgi:hypothetical protein
MLNGLHGAIGMVNGTLNGLRGTIGMLNGLHRMIRTENRGLNDLHGMTRMVGMVRTVGTLWPFAFQKLLVFFIIIIYLFTLYLQT